MSIANLEVPNSLDLYCGSLTFGSNNSSGLNDYEEFSISSTISGFITTPTACAITLVRIGKTVTYWFSMAAASIQSANGFGIVATAIPERFRPVAGNTLRQPVVIKNEDVFEVGALNIELGVFRFSRADLGQFTSSLGKNNSIANCGGSYSIV